MKIHSSFWCINSYFVVWSFLNIKICFNNFECLPNFYKYLFGRNGQCVSCLEYQLSCKIDREIQMTSARTLAHTLAILTELLEIFMNYVRKIFNSYFYNFGWPDHNICWQFHECISMFLWQNRHFPSHDFFVYISLNLGFFRKIEDLWFELRE